MNFFDFTYSNTPLGTFFEYRTKPVALFNKNTILIENTFGSILRFCGGLLFMFSYNSNLEVFGYPD